MSRQQLEHAARDLVWSLWTELGVPGVVRRHQRTVVDPEVLIVASPAVFFLDPRLRDQVYGWCGAHAGRVSSSRVQGLVGALMPPARSAFGSFAATLRDHAKIRWPTGNAEPWAHVPEVPRPRLPVERPALLRLRLRALCGVGARADVVAALLASAAGWTRASNLADEGYTKRNVARILSELSDAGIANSRAERNVLTFQLAHADTLRELINGNDMAFPDWRLIMQVVLEAMDLVALESRPEATRRVEAHSCRERLKPLSDRLWLDTPPVTRGKPEAWERMTAWVADQVGLIAEGTSPALGVEQVRAAAIDGGGEAWIWLHRTAVDFDRLSKNLERPHTAADGVSLGATVPDSGGWTAYQLVFQPRLEEARIRKKVEHLVWPMKVSWRRVASE